MICPNCGTELSDDSRFCKYCGCGLIRICPVCEKELPYDSSFCNHCGKPTSANDEYIDLGLPSGTKWKNINEEGLYSFNEAVGKYGNRLPTREQLEELKNQCKWEWIGNGYKVIGPNGNSIVLSTAFCCVYRGDNSCLFGRERGSCADYWSSTLNDSHNAGLLDICSSYVAIRISNQNYRHPVRLVQN